MQQSRHRGIRSYVLRQGRLTRGQQRALEQHWSRYGIDYSPALLQTASLFAREAPLVMEIGFGNGESLIEQAVAHPEHNFIGIEVHRPGVGHCLQLAAEHDLHNLRVINHDAVEVLREQIADASLDKLQLFFPDPWHKKRHHKRRLLQADFIATLARKLKPSGRLHLATDWDDYAQHMREEMAASEVFELTSSERGERPMTKFEQRGLKLGHRVHDLVYTRR